MRRNLNMMIKPSSSKCNMTCKYCFYNSISEAREVEDYGFMSKENIAEVVKKAKEYCNGGICTIGFQGGESLLVGKDFYRHLVKCIEDNDNGTSFNLTIQTNGTLIDAEWAKFFKDNNILLGVSLDGTKEIHDLTRINHKGEDTFIEVMKGINILKQYKVDFNILAVVTSYLCKNIEESYKFFKENEFKYLQFIPCLEPLENNNSPLSGYSISSKEYGEFMIKLFDMWYEDAMNDNYVSIRYFDNILALFYGYRYEACEMSGVCSCQNIIESDGSVYPCDFYTYEKFRVGNILEETFEEINYSDKTVNFIRGSANNNPKCHQCKYMMICRGGCRRYREDGEDKLNFLCEGYYNFFTYSFEKFKEIAKKKRSQDFGK